MLSTDSKGATRIYFKLADNEAMNNIPLRHLVEDRTYHYVDAGAPIELVTQTIGFWGREKFWPTYRMKCYKAFTDGSNHLKRIALEDDKTLLQYNWTDGDTLLIHLIDPDVERTKKFDVGGYLRNHKDMRMKVWFHQAVLQSMLQRIQRRI